MTEARARLDALPTTYPRLFPNGPLTWGFEVGDGWSALIVLLCERLDTILQEVPQAQMTVKQVKEKFGGLRFYYSLDGASDEVAATIGQTVQSVTAACMHVCERCGGHGEVNKKEGWLTTMCVHCLAAL